MNALIQELKTRVGTDRGSNSRQASDEDLARARELGFPGELLEFYSQCEPTKWFDLGVRLWSICNAIDENTKAVPGLGLAPKGILVFASTGSGDAFCVDTTTKNPDGTHPILLYSHETIDEDTTSEELAEQRLQVATSFEDFLRQYLDNTLNEEPNYG